MLVPELKKPKLRVVGVNQVLRLVRTGAAEKVFIAGNAEEQLIKPVRELCLKGKVPVVKVNSMQELGKACGIQVEASAAALLKQ